MVTTAEAKVALMVWLESSPLKVQQGQVIAGLTHWFLKQEPYVQTAIISGIDRGMENAYATALRKLADDIESRESAALRVPANTYAQLEHLAAEFGETVEQYIIAMAEPATTEVTEIDREPSSSLPEEPKARSRRRAGTKRGEHVSG